MTVVLLCGAGLLVRTVIALNNANNGFDKHDVLTMEIRLPDVRYTPERTRAFYREAVAALRALPGVESAAAANSLAVDRRRFVAEAGFTALARRRCR